MQRHRRQRIPALAIGRGATASISSGLGIMLGLAGIAALWVAVAAPVKAGVAGDETPARNLMLVLDVSASMAESEGEVTRVVAARAVVERFLRLRRQDRIGLVVFARQAAVVAPLTRDHRSVLALAENMQPGELGPGTAIGDALAVALERLRVAGNTGGLVLVSDGEHNAGNLDPATAAAVAAGRNVPVDAVMVGTSEAGQEQMAAIAAITGGHLVYAPDARSLDRAFRDLSRLRETPEMTPRARFDSRAHIPGGIAALLLVAAVAAELATWRAWT